MKKIYNWAITALSSISADKYMHFSLGVITSTVVLLTSLLFFPVWASALLGGAVAGGLGALKEYLDRTLNGTSSKADLYATIAGGAIPSIVAIVIHLIS